MATKLIFAVVAAVLLASCSPKPPPAIDWRSFDGKRAMTHVETLVNMGPRPSGSSALGKAAAYINSQLEEAGLEPKEQVFVAATPRGPIQFRNIFAKTAHPDDLPRQVIIVASHYDTKYLPNMNFVGANDAGSSTGVLLELARCAANQPDIWFVFFDGEEAVKDYTDDDGLTGSKAFVQELKGNNQIDSIKCMILLDMVGSRTLKIEIPPNSTGLLSENVFEAARDVGYRDFFGLGKMEMLDDFVPFLRVGIPAVDLIDFHYGSAPGLNDYWHTDQDTLDKLSPHSLEVVGQTTLRLLARLEAGAAVR